MAKKKGRGMCRLPIGIPNGSTERRKTRGYPSQAHQFDGGAGHVQFGGELLKLSIAFVLLVYSIHSKCTKKLIYARDRSQKGTIFNILWAI